MKRILIADPDPGTQRDLRGILEHSGHTTLCVPDGTRALSELLEDPDIELVLAETKLPGLDGRALLRELRQQRPEVAVILLTAFGTVEDAVSAMREGAADFLGKPFSQEQVRLAIDRALERAALVRENQDLRDALDDRLELDNFVATDARMQAVCKTIRAVAPTRTTVLITGESGTGKTLLARALHRLSDRRQGPFVEVNCGALPETLLESELFGHVRGAFTGAVKDRPGKFEAAHGGTIFLDEVGTSSPGFQVKLLRVLQERQIERVGDTRTIPVDVRVVLATNLDLAAAVREGRFREDLYYRIHVVTVEMPPLRARRDDIPLLARHFLHRIARETGRAVTGITPRALALLQQAPWPGNVRQLENVIERAIVLCESAVVDVGDLPPDLGAIQRPDLPATPVAGPGLLWHPGQTLREALDGAELQILQAALAQHGGSRQTTAQALRINRSTLFHKLRRYGLG